VLAENHIRAGNKVEEAGVDHSLGPAARLFRGLENRDDRSLPVCALVHEPLQGPEEAGDVDVVAAGMHDRYVLAVLINTAGSAGVVQSCRLFYGQAVHVRPQQDCPARPVREDADNTGDADAGVHGETQGMKMLSRNPGGPVFLKGKLGVCMQVPVQLLNIYAHTAV
jgi:hypothetical protein